MAVVAVENFNAPENDAVASDDDGGEPQGESPTGFPPVHQAEGDDGGEEQGFVSNWVDEGAEVRALVETSRDPAIDAVRRGGGHENAECPPAERLDGSAAFDAEAVEKRKRRINRHEADSGDGDFAGQGHSLKQADCGA